MNAQRAFCLSIVLACFGGAIFCAYLAGQKSPAEAQDHEHHFRGGTVHVDAPGVDVDADWRSRPAGDVVPDAPEESAPLDTAGQPLTAHATLAAMAQSINQARQRSGLPALRVDASLTYSAQHVAEAIATRGLEALDDGLSSARQFDGYTVGISAAGPRSVAELLDDWLRREAGRKRLLSQYASDVGCGYSLTHTGKTVWYVFVGARN